MKKIVSRIGKDFINETHDVRNMLHKAFKVGASVDEACELARVPKKLYDNWEYTHHLISEIKNLMYSLNLDNYTDITDEIINDNTDYEIDIYLLNELKKNKYYANDVFMLIEKCNQYKAEVIIEHLNRIRYTSKQKNNEWKSSAWYLERINPIRYGKKDPDKIESKDDIKTEKITIQYIDPKSADERIKNLEQLVREEIEGKK